MNNLGDSWFKNSLKNSPHIFSNGHKIINIPDGLIIECEFMEEVVPEGVLVGDCDVKEEVFEVLHLDGASLRGLQEQQVYVVRVLKQR